MDKGTLDSTSKRRTTVGYIIVVIGAMLMISAIIMAISRGYARLELPLILFASGIVVFVLGALIVPRDKFNIN